MRKPYIFHSTAPLQTKLTGDFAYTTRLAAETRTQDVSAEYMPEQSIEEIQAKFARVIRKDPEAFPILHIQLRPPHQGTAVDFKRLKEFPCVVVTVHEFANLKEDENRDTVLDYIRKADHVIFTTRAEQNAVAEHMSDISDRSSIIPVFNTLPLFQLPPSHERPNNILHFGTLRSTNGVEHAVQLAGLIKRDPYFSHVYRTDPEKAAKVIIAGKPVSAVCLHKLACNMLGIMQRDAPWHSDFMHQANENERIDIVKQGLFEATRGGKYRIILPISLHLAVKDNELPRLFGRSRFAYLPKERGVDEHSAALPSVMQNGCITIATAGEETPAVLKQGAVLFAQTPAEALNTIKPMLYDMSRDEGIIKRAQQYLETISPESAARRHVAIYGALSRLMPQERTQRHWQHTVAAERATPPSSSKGL